MMVVLTFLRSLVGALTNPAALLLIAIAFTTGSFRGSAGAEQRCNAAALQSQIDALQLDRKSLDASVKRFEREAADNAAQADRNSKIVQEINHGQKNPACRLSPDDARRLRDIR